MVAGAEGFGRDDGDLLFTVQLFIQLGEAVSNIIDPAKTLVLGKNNEELSGGRVQLRDAVEGFVELGDFLETDTCVLGEKLEGLRVLVEGLQVDNVFVHCVESLLSRS